MTPTSSVLAVHESATDVEPVALACQVVGVLVGASEDAPWQWVVPESVKVLPASGTNCQS